MPNDTAINPNRMGNHKQINSSQTFHFPDVTSRRQCMTSGWVISDLPEGVGWGCTLWQDIYLTELLNWYLINFKWLILYLDARDGIVTSQFHGHRVFPELGFLSSPWVCSGFLSPSFLKNVLVEGLDLRSECLALFTRGIHMRLGWLDRKLTALSTSVHT